MSRSIIISGKQSLSLLFAAGIMGSAFALMNLVSDIRIHELSYSLKNMSANRASGSSLSLISRFILLKKRAAGKLEAVQETQSESELLTITSAGFSDLESTNEISWSEKKLIHVFNFFYRVSGSKAIIDFDEEKRQQFLEVAFMYERKRNFKSAIEAYRAALNNYRGKADTVAYIYLHLGFCKAMSGKKKLAIKDLKKSKKYDPLGEIGYTADIIGNFLKEMQTQLKVVREMVNSVDKAEMLYRITAYNEAIRTLKKLGKKKNQRYLFLRGRAYEETGKNKLAIHDYNRLIKMNVQSKWARKANRRLYMLGAFYEDDQEIAKKVAKQAVVLAKVQGDLEFIKASKKYKDSVEDDKVLRSKKSKVVEQIKNDIQEEVQIAKEIKKEEIKKKELELKNNPNIDTNIDTGIEDEAEDQVLVPVPVVEKTALKNKQVKSDFNNESVVAYQSKSFQNKKPKWAEDGKISKKETQAIKKAIKKIVKKNKAKYIRQVLRAGQTPRKKRKKILLSRFPKLDKITTEEGNIYYGIISKKNTYETEILTVVGPVKIPNEIISHKERELTKKTFLESEIGHKEGEIFTSIGSKIKSKLLSKKLSQGKRKKIFKKYFKQLDKIQTKDGNILFGLVYTVDDKKTRIITVIGMINVPEEMIIERTKVSLALAFSDGQNSNLLEENNYIEDDSYNEDEDDEEDTYNEGEDDYEEDSYNDNKENTNDNTVIDKKENTSTKNSNELSNKSTKNSSVSVEKNKQESQKSSNAFSTSDTSKVNEASQDEQDVPEENEDKLTQ